MKHYPVNLERYNQAKKEYQEELATMEWGDLIKELFTYLDYTEVSDSGKVYHPINIGSSRVMLGEALNDLLKFMRQSV